MAWKGIGDAIGAPPRNDAAGSIVDNDGVVRRLNRVEVLAHIVGAIPNRLADILCDGIDELGEGFKVARRVGMAH